MHRLALPLLAVFLTGCQIGWVVPPADGRVVDSRSLRPVGLAEVTRTSIDSRPTTSKTDPDGYFSFRGKRELQSAVGVRVPPQATYHITATGYQSVSTNGFAFGGSNAKGLRHSLGDIQIQPE